MWNKVFSQLNLIRFGLAITSVAVILLFLPRADHQSFSFEENQPWKYPLLTADFDTPILRDSASARKMRDSIDRVFVPFVKRDVETEKANVERFANIIQNYSTPSERALLMKLVRQTYANGILDAKLYADVAARGNHELRLVDSESGDSKSVVAVNASSMLSPAKAFGKIDSIFSHEFHGGEGKLSPEIGKALNLCLTPNIVTDSATDYKYRSQEYLNVTGAMGVIKKGQRIVDRGEIINPQIFTNLNVLHHRARALYNNSVCPALLLHEPIQVEILFQHTPDGVPDVVHHAVCCVLDSDVRICGKRHLPCAFCGRPGDNTRVFRFAYSNIRPPHHRAYIFTRRHLPVPVHIYGAVCRPRSNL